MATIYLSSTYNDLRAYREEVYKALRQSRQEVIAMEDYVASDRRPVDQCLQNVGRADIYVGLFAFRYGYIPPPAHNNPRGLSITEMEFRHAKANNKPCLIFVLVEEKQKNWPAEFIDAHTGEDKGKRIDALRTDLCTQQIVSFFSTPEKLSAQVLAALLSNETTKGLIAARVSEHDLPPTVRWDIATQGSPYPGLLSFSREYAPVFFGRELEVRAILDRLHEPAGRFLIVSGDSGVGKSSMIEAGVIPKLEAGRLPGGKTGLCVRMLASQGEQPCTALMKLLQPFAQNRGLTPQEIEQVTKEVEVNPPSLSDHLRALTERGPDGTALVLFLDQLEEWFPKDEPTQPAVSQDFLSALYQATQEGALWVLATIRSDHLHRCDHHPAMLNVLRGRGLYPLDPIKEFMLWDMIRKPARCAGLTITDQLVSTLVKEMMNNPGSLPLLAFVLQELCEHRTQQGELSEAVYQNFNGLTGAIAKHAAQVETKIQQQLAGKATPLWPTLFRKLVIVDADGLPSRQRLFPAGLDDPDLAKLVKVLIDERLLYSEKEGGAISLSHEKLLEAWPRLAEWLKENKEFLVWQQRLRGAINQYEESKGKQRKGHPDFLLRGFPLRKALEWLEKKPESFRDKEKKFVLASKKRKIRDRVVATMYACLALGAVAFLLTPQKPLRISKPLWMLGPEMIRISPGSFMMGGPGLSDEAPVHEVHFSKPFAIARYETTREEYDLFAIAMQTKDGPLLVPNDQRQGRDSRPVINVSWEDAKAYAKWLSKATGKRYRLPTESEWEYAARSGGKDEVWAGTSDEKQLNKFAVYNTDKTEPVGSKQPNGLGLYDMSGNVSEWVEDCWHKNYRGAPTDGSAWLETNGADCRQHVLRGGSWYNFPENLRVSYRHGFDADYRFINVGFRLAQDLEP